MHHARPTYSFHTRDRSIGSLQSKYMLHFDCKFHTAVTPLKQSGVGHTKMTDQFTNWSNIKTFFLQATTFSKLNLPQQPAALPLSVSCGCFGRLLQHTYFTIKYHAGEIIFTSKTHVAVAIVANFSSILRVVLDTAQHGCPSYPTACLSP